MSSESLHAPRERLSREAVLMHQAIASLREELDAVDWYRQRADDTDDDDLKALLLHNMREEIEHSAMLLEWIRRFDHDFAEHLQTYLFTTGAILTAEAAATGTAAQAPTAAPQDDLGGFTIGSLLGSRDNGHS